MSKKPKIIEEINEGEMVLRLEGEADYYSHSGRERIALTAKKFEVVTGEGKDYSIDRLIMETTCSKIGATLAIMGYPKTATQKLRVIIEPHQKSEGGVCFSWMNEGDITSPAYSGGEDVWLCSINVSEKFHDKLIKAYQLNRINSLEIDISSSTGAKARLWRKGMSSHPINYYSGDDLFLRPDSGCTAMAYAICREISYTEPPVFQDGIVENKNQIKQDELTATLISIKKHLRLAAICLFLIAVILIFK